MNRKKGHSGVSNSVRSFLVFHTFIFLLQLKTLYIGTKIRMRVYYDLYQPHLSNIPPYYRARFYSIRILTRCIAYQNNKPYQLVKRRETKIAVNTKLNGQSKEGFC